MWAEFNKLIFGGSGPNGLISSWTPALIVVGCAWFLLGGLHHLGVIFPGGFNQTLKSWPWCGHYNSQIIISVSHHLQRCEVARIDPALCFRNRIPELSKACSTFLACILKDLPNKILQKLIVLICWVFDGVWWFQYVSIYLSTHSKD